MFYIYVSKNRNFLLNMYKTSKSEISTNRLE